ncbi:hypothetical protein Pth03_41170 [Planotetraspora thailandica]|uniref:ABM domain-containing protein n=1 Tax=Planotetraspora thailandica TaxID=487172 RepID=A0A8J3XZ11_9ACTN|nr:antibiotic biosynthesis monooxygenase [Planotetraspora thailandica]GII55728.1 hypothetical protein Pth03_41170 [Planotetraspora thailandica]
MFAIVVHHYAEPEHVEEFKAFCRKISDGMQGTEGMLSIEGYHDRDNERLTILSRWQSPEAAKAGVARLTTIAQEVGGRDAAWSWRDDEVMRLHAF